MKLIFQNLSVNKKLFAFTVLTSLLVLAALGTGAFYFLQIERSNLLKEDVAKTVETMLVTRGAEKTYLQFFKAEEKKEFQTQAQKVTGSFEKLKSSTAGEALKGQVSSMEAHFENYQKLFGQIDELHSRQNGLREEMIKPLRASEEALRKMQTDIETKQSDLQMQGDTLSPEEFGMLNVVTDCRDSFVELQNLQLQYLLTGDQKFIDEYKKAYNEGPISGFHAQAYDAAELLMKALQKVAVTDASGATQIGRKALRDAVFATKFDGVSGPIECDAHGECGKFHPAVYEYTNADPKTFSIGTNPKKVYP